MHHITDLQVIAAQHLRLLRDDRARIARSESYYVGLGFTYGLTVPEIAEQSGMSVPAVQQILAAA